MSEPIRWSILGAGAIGTLLCFRLQQTGIDATLIHHRGTTERWLRVDGETHAFTAEDLHQQAQGSIPYLMLTTKAGQLGAALTASLPYLARHAVIATTANGLGFEGELAHIAGGRALLRAVSTEAAYRDEDQTVVYAGRGETHIGNPESKAAAPPWFAASLGALDRWHWDPAIDLRLQRKFAINCVINPLTALHGCLNGDLIRVATHRRELRELSTEIESALRELQQWNYPESLIDVAEAVCSSTADNRSSMLQDVLAGRATELPYLNGELQRRASGSNIDLPFNARLLEALGGVQTSLPNP